MPVEVILPKVDMAMEEGSIQAWHVADGDMVRAGQLLFEIGTDKSVMEVEAPASGRLRLLHPAGDDTMPVGTTVALLLQDGEQWPPEPTGTASPASVQAPVAIVSTETVANRTISHADLSNMGEPRRPRATPLARSLARQAGIALDKLNGTGPDGRIRARDVPIASPTGEPDEGRLVPFTPVRRVIAERLADSARTAPHFYMSAQIDMTSVLEARRSLADSFAQSFAGRAPSLTAILASIVGRLLPRHPALNASVEGAAMRIRPRADIGIAMDRDGELVVPVLRGCDSAPLTALCAAFEDLRRAASAKTLTPSQTRGGTFTISNLGTHGVDQFTAIINPPEAAILAVGRIRETPVGLNGQIVLRPCATLCLSSDHRIVDGAAAARFMAALRDRLECHELLLYLNK